MSLVNEIVSFFIGLFIVVFLGYYLLSLGSPRVAKYVREKLFPLKKDDKSSEVKVSEGTKEIK
jgi:uncharacterized membrane protein SpoIIM required for sporulation